MYNIFIYIGKCSSPTSDTIGSSSFFFFFSFPPSVYQFYCIGICLVVYMFVYVWGSLWNLQASLLPYDDDVLPCIKIRKYILHRCIATLVHLEQKNKKKNKKKKEKITNHNMKKIKHFSVIHILLLIFFFLFFFFL